MRLLPELVVGLLQLVLLGPQQLFGLPQGRGGRISVENDLRVTGFMKPLATLMNPLRSVDLATGRAQCRHGLVEGRCDDDDVVVGGDEQVVAHRHPGEELAPLGHVHEAALDPLHGQRRRDLVRGAAEDDHGAGQLVAQVGQRERSRHDTSGDRVVAARVHRFDRAIRPEHRHGVVEGDQADRRTRTSAGEGRAERAAHSGDTALDLQPGLLQDVAEVARTFALLMRELRMLVDEAMRRERGVPLRLDSREDPLVLESHQELESTIVVRSQPASSCAQGIAGSSWLVTSFPFFSRRQYASMCGSPKFTLHRMTGCP